VEKLGRCLGTESLIYFWKVRVRLVITNTLLKKYKQLFLGNPIPEAKWVLRGRIVTNNTSPLHGSGNQQYVIQEEGEKF